MRFSSRSFIKIGLAMGMLASVLGVSTAHATTTFRTPVIVTNEDFFSEPGIDVAPDGTMYINSISGFPTPPANVWRSTNLGSSWTLLPESVKAAEPGGGDADIAIDPKNGSLYETDLWLGDSTASVSQDKGETWLANPIQGLPVQDRQWVASSGNGIVYHGVHQIPGGLLVSKSIGGLVYATNTVAATALDQTGCICPPGNLIAEAGAASPVGANDKVGLIYSTSTDGVNFARSTDGGITFTNVPVQPSNIDSNNDTTTNFPVVANAGGGKLVAVWQEVLGNPGTRTRTRFASSSNWGATWSAPKTLVSAGTSLYPWVAAKGSKISISLYHTSTATTPDKAPKSTVWYEKYLESTNGGATFGSLVTADATAIKTGPICTGGIDCSGNRELGDFQQVAIDSTGRAVLSYVRSLDNKDNTQVRFVRQT